MTTKSTHRFQTKYDNRNRQPLFIDPKEGRTKGSFKDETDINKIMSKYLRTGQLPALIRSNPAYGDFSDVPSYQEALARVSMAQEAFLALPAQVRAECENDPKIFLQKVQDPAWSDRHKLALLRSSDPTPSPASPPPSPAPGGEAGAKSSGKKDA